MRQNAVRLNRLATLQYLPGLFAPKTISNRSSIVSKILLPITKDACLLPSTVMQTSFRAESVAQLDEGYYKAIP